MSDVLTADDLDEADRAVAEMLPKTLSNHRHVVARSFEEARRVIDEIKARGDCGIVEVQQRGQPFAAALVGYRTANPGAP